MYLTATHARTPHLPVDEESGDSDPGEDQAQRGSGKAKAPCQCQGLTLGGCVCDEDWDALLDIDSLPPAYMLTGVTGCVSCRLKARVRVATRSFKWVY